MTTQHPQTLPTNQLQPNPLQPRGKVMPDQLDELVVSIKQFGILEPLIVAQTPAGYQIIAGERRWRAAKVAQLAEVPVIVKVTTPKGMLEMALIENVQRVDLSPMERAQAYQQLLRDFRFSQTQIADRIGKSIAHINNTLRLLTLPDAIKDGLAGELISEGHARALAGIEDERTQVEVYKILLRENASVRRAEELVRKVKNHLPIAGEPQMKQKKDPFKMPSELSPHLDKWQAQLQGLFNPEVSQVKLTQSMRQTKVTFIFKGGPDEIKDQLEVILTKMRNKAS